MMSTYKQTEILADKVLEKSAALSFDTVKKYMTLDALKGYAKKTGKFGLFIGDQAVAGTGRLVNSALGAAASGFGKEMGSQVAGGIGRKLFPTGPSTKEVVGKTLQTIGVGLGVGAGVVGIASLIEKYNIRKREMNAPIMFQEMLLKNPDVNEFYLSGEENKKRIEDLFKLLEHFSPKISENALASGTFIRQYMKFGDLGANIDIIGALARINKDSQESGNNLTSTTAKTLFDQSAATGFREFREY